jgi:hypothetical protein
VSNKLLSTEQAPSLNLSVSGLTSHALAGAKNVSSNTEPSVVAQTNCGVLTIATIAANFLFDNGMFHLNDCRPGSIELVCVSKNQWTNFPHLPSTFS